MSEQLKHAVEFHPGHDCMRFECWLGAEDCRPGAPHSHGKHGLEISFITQGDAGAIEFRLGTGWLPQYTKPDSTGFRYVKDWGISPLPMYIRFHSRKPLCDKQTPDAESCEYCGKQPCYSGMSSLNADHAMYALVNGGEDALWKYLDEYYASVFQDGDGPVPVPAEYPRTLREPQGELI